MRTLARTPSHLQELPGAAVAGSRRGRVEEVDDGSRRNESDAFSPECATTVVGTGKTRSVNTLTVRHLARFAAADRPSDLGASDEHPREGRCRTSTRHADQNLTQGVANEIRRVGTPIGESDEDVHRLRCHALVMNCGCSPSTERENARRLRVSPCTFSVWTRVTPASNHHQGQSIIRVNPSSASIDHQRQTIINWMERNWMERKNWMERNWMDRNWMDRNWMDRARPTVLIGRSDQVSVPTFERRHPHSASLKCLRRLPGSAFELSTRTADIRGPANTGSNEGIVRLVRVRGMPPGHNGRRSTRMSIE